MAANLAFAQAAQRKQNYARSPIVDLDKAIIYFRKSSYYVKTPNDAEFLRYLAFVGERNLPTEKAS